MIEAITEDKLVWTQDKDQVPQSIKKTHVIHFYTPLTLFFVKN